MPVLSTTEQLPGVLPITIYHGATFVLALTWTDDSGTPVNLSGYTAEMRVAKPDQTTVILCSTTTGEIVLGGAAGTVTVTIPADTTATFAPMNGGQYDLMLTSGTDVVYPLLAGAAAVRASVTVS